jgi:hypothetical protein
MSFFSKRVNFTQQWSTNNKQQHLRHHRVGDLFFIHPGFLVPFVIFVISSMFCYYAARIACKVLMQGLGYSTPVTFLVLFVASLKGDF